ncbi:hypothetical protein EDD52_101286 [Primorskyibacter sedentarius]|uniref:Uncharacterized protein n=1 Tax=Primorskyibacter sedentarius TaxID=745311 RepID=A0A4R3JLR3_9RHOB|nr:hypothetical protein [Primorskyibacter sedentarius]TCS67191.1 hypothetical protein EDD52_101286 [Primorskyibacter sedentarius]
MNDIEHRVQDDWVIPVLGIAMALAIAIGCGFLIGQQAPTVTADVSTICEGEQIAECAALRSAVATEQATWISQWALWVSFGTLVAGIGALGGLITAYSHGRRTIKLALDANRISMQNNQSQARAYVVVQAVECRLDGQGRLSTRVQFQNSGLTPARQLRWLHGADLNIVSKESEQISFRVGDEPDPDNSHWRRDIPSAETWTTTPVGLPEPDYPEISSLIAEAVFIAATVKIVADYEDVFGVSHRETACFQGRVVFEVHNSDYCELERAHDGVFEVI